MKKIIKPLIAVIVIALAAFLIYSNYSQISAIVPVQKKAESVLDRVKTVKLKRGKFIVEITDVGTLVQSRAVPVFTPSMKTNVLKLCKEGSYVKKGDFLALLGNDTYTKLAAERELEYHQAVAELKDAEEELRIQTISSEMNIATKEAQQQYDETELQVAKAELDRQMRLYKEQIVTLKDVESQENIVRAKELTAAQGDIDVKLEKQKALSEAAKKKSNINIKRTKAEKARNKYESTALLLKKTNVTAPDDGVVTFRKFYRGGDMRMPLGEGDELGGGTIIMEISDVSSLVVDVDISESSVSRVTEGMKVSVIPEAFPDRIFPGRVKSVSNIAETPEIEFNSGPPPVSFPAVVSLDRIDPEIMRPGVKVTVKIMEKEIDSVLSVPITAVFSEKAVKYVWLKKGSSFEKCIVETGDSNSDSVVVSGLDEGAEIAVSSPFETEEQSDSSSEKKASAERDRKPSSDR